MATDLQVSTAFSVAPMSSGWTNSIKRRCHQLLFGPAQQLGPVGIQFQKITIEGGDDNQVEALAKMRWFSSAIFSSASSACFWNVMSLINPSIMRRFAWLQDHAADFFHPSPLSVPVLQAIAQMKLFVCLQGLFHHREDAFAVFGMIESRSCSLYPK